ncbi:MAG: TIGR03000 domain-containing protein [Gemmataceae bacterium]|nr:TIGR03000 domain-containing protein [Gemmataceae bacterium]MCI0738346.1 TIGR03000 domain-containing protein [Gemmataceae bacterium]
MRKLAFSGLFALAVVAGCLLTPEQASAQRFTIGGGNFRVDVGRPYYGRGYNAWPGYYGRGYYDGYYRGNYYGRWYYPGYYDRYTYRSPAAEFYVAPRNSYYYTGTYSGSSTPYVQPAAVATATAQIEIVAPNSNARVWFRGVESGQTGPSHWFDVTQLESGRAYSFEVEARWMQNGREMRHTRMIQVNAGQNLRVDLSRS